MVVSYEIIAPTALYPGKKPTVPTVQKAGWTPVSVDTVEKGQISAHCRKSIPDSALIQYIGSHYTEWPFWFPIVCKLNWMNS
jgi:hypothetical protein